MIVNGVDTNTIDYNALGSYMRAQQQISPELAAYLASLPPDPGALSASELVNYGNQRRQLSDTYGNALAGINQQRGSLQAQEGVDAQGLTQNWDQQLQHLPGGYAHRGLLHSGIYANGIDQYGQSRQNAFAQMAQKYQSGLGALDTQQQQANTSYTSGMSQVDSSEAAARADLAAQLKGLQ